MRVAYASSRLSKMERHRLWFTTPPEVAIGVYTQEADDEDAGGLAAFPYGHKRGILL